MGLPGRARRGTMSQGGFTKYFPSGGRAMRRTKLIGSVLGAAALLVSVAGCGGGSVWPEDRSGPRVLTSFAPIHCIALNVAGDDAVVLPLMTDRGPHGFTGGARDARKLKGADLFLINGLG